METREEILKLVRKYYREKFGSRKFDTSKDFVHYAGRVFDEKELVNLVDASLDFFLTADHHAEQFETRFAKYMGLPNALLVNSGSSANSIAFKRWAVLLSLPLRSVKAFSLKNKLVLLWRNSDVGRTRCYT